MKITTFGRNEHRMLSAVIVAALKDVGDKFGVDLTAAGGHFGTTSGDIKIKVALRDTTTGADSREADFKFWAPRMGVPAHAFGQTVRIRRELFRIVGINPNAPKNCLMIERLGDNKPYVCPWHTVASQIPAAIAA